LIDRVKVPGLTTPYSNEDRWRRGKVGASDLSCCVVAQLCSQTEDQTHNVLVSLSVTLIRAADEGRSCYCDAVEVLAAGSPHSSYRLGPPARSVSHRSHHQRPSTTCDAGWPCRPPSPPTTAATSCGCSTPPPSHCSHQTDRVGLRQEGQQKQHHFTQIGLWAELIRSSTSS